MTSLGDLYIVCIITIALWRKLCIVAPRHVTSAPIIKLLGCFTYMASIRVLSLVHPPWIIIITPFKLQRQSEWRYKRIFVGWGSSERTTAARIEHEQSNASKPTYWKCSKRERNTSEMLLVVTGIQNSYTDYPERDSNRDMQFYYWKECVSTYSWTLLNVYTLRNSVVNFSQWLSSNLFVKTPGYFLWCIYHKLTVILIKTKKIRLE